ncbi:MAG: hypothetical protein J6X88_06815 [Bacteroidales bacterium]|nr:hypothetical protein [Bacteroidales bacterium]
MILNSSLTGIGRMGNIVGRKGPNGRTYTSIYQPYVSNPKSPAQVEQRAKLSLASKVASMLGVVGKQALVANGYSASRFCTLVGQILGTLTDGEGYSSPSLLTGLPLVKRPGGDITYSEKGFTFVTPTEQASGSVAYKFIGTPNVDDTLVRYCVALMLYNVTADLWTSQSWVLDTAGTVRIYINSDWKNAQIYAYAYVLGVLRNGNGVLENTASLGSLVGDQSKFQLTVDSENVLYGKYNYAQIDSFIAGHTLAAL